MSFSLSRPRTFLLGSILAAFAGAACSAAPTEVGDPGTASLDAPLHAESVASNRVAPARIPSRALRLEAVPESAGFSGASGGSGAGATPTLFSHGGTTLHNAGVAIVRWGSNVDSATVGKMGTFYQDALVSDYIDWLRELDSAIGRGRFMGVYTITPSITGTNVTQDQIEAELEAQISAGNVIFNDANRLYAVYLPPGVTTTASDGSRSCVAGGFCAYHSWSSNGSIRYAVFPDMGTGSGCESACGGNAGDAFKNATSVASHELIEAITDPAGGGFYDADGLSGEIGDICNQQNATRNLNGTIYTVQKQWSNDLASCISGPWQPGYQLESNATFKPGGGIAATARVSTALDTWTIGTDGAMWNAGWWDGAFHPAYRFAQQAPTSFVAGGGIAASSLNANNIDTWVIGTDGALWNAGWWDGAQHAGYRFPQQAPTTFIAGGGIAASVNGSNVDTWTIGPDGALWNAGYLSAGFHAGYRFPQQPANVKFVVGGGIAACSITPGKFDTWVIGPDGALWNAGWYDSAGFHAGYRVPTSPTGTFTPGAPVACSIRNGVMDLWTVGKDGGLFNAAYFNGSFQGGYRVEPSAPGSYFAQSNVAAVSRNSAMLDTFVIGKDGLSTNAAWWHERN